MTDKELFESYLNKISDNRRLQVSRIDLHEQTFLAACEVKNKEVKELEEKLGVAREALQYLESEIIRGKTKDCIGCCNGVDIPEMELCRACCRIYFNRKMFLLWDWQLSESRIRVALEKIGKI